MFGWIKEKAQNGFYAMRINSIAHNFGKDHAAMASINAGAAVIVVQTIRRFRDPCMFFDDMLRDNPSI